jgi:hypothetical protein
MDKRKRADLDQHKGEATQLPFVIYDPDRGIESWWSLPATGGYQGGCGAGAAAGKAFMKYLRSERGAGFVLPWVVESMVIGKGKSDTLHGQIVGFFGVLGSALANAAKLDSGLDTWSYYLLREKIEEGLKFDEEAFAERHDRQRRSEAAKLGHQRRGLRRR